MFPGQVSMPRWTPERIKLLRKLYPSRPSLEVAQELGVSVKAVTSKASRLGLRKTPARLKRMGKESVRTRHDRQAR